MTQSITLLPHDKVAQFILAGKATVIFHNPQTGNSHKYRINKHKLCSLWYVNTADYIVNKLVGKIVISHDQPTFKPDMIGTHTHFKSTEVFEWMWKRIIYGKVPSYIEIMHAGTCGYCGRPLTDVESLTAGFGPECRKRLGITI